MNRRPLAIAAVLSLSAAAAGCSPQCTCPATAPTPLPTGVSPAMPPTFPPPAPAQSTPAEAGPVRLLNEGPAVRRMRTVYPPHLLAGGTRGDVVIEATLDADGRVQSVIDVEANNDQFRGAAMTVAQELRFTAPPAAGTTVRLRMRFQPSGSRIEVLTQ